MPDNRQLVRESLDALKSPLRKYAEEKLQKTYGPTWQDRVTEWRDARRRPSRDEPDVGPDTAALLSVVINHWGAFRGSLDQLAFGRIRELKDVRNRWAHEEPFGVDETFRAIDTTQLVLWAIGEKTLSRDLNRLKAELKGAEKPAPETPAVSRLVGAPLGQHAVFGSFVEFMDAVVLPRRAAHPEHRRLDGQTFGSNREVIGRFRHAGSVWRVNADSHYEPLLLAYDAAVGENSNPFIPQTTRGGGQSLALREDIQRRRGTPQKNLYIYRDSST